jgi:ParB family chromosome partitioning protein
MAGKRVELGLDALDNLPLLDGSEPGPPVSVVRRDPPPSADASAESGQPTLVQLPDVAENPVNRREQFGDLEELAASMRAVGQVQACAAVTRRAFISIYPEHESALAAARYVLVAGARRHRAAQLNKTPLEVRVNDAWAQSRGHFYAACIAENGPRLNFLPWEEAVAIRELAQELGSNKAAAERLGLSAQVVSQRLSIFRLSEPMQELLRAGDLPIEPARTIAANVEPDRQLQVWLEQRWREARKVPKPPTPDSPPPARRGRPPRSVRVQWPIEAEAGAIAAELRKVLDSRVIAELVEELRVD